MLNNTFKILALVFFAIAVAVHIYGLFYPITSETTASHIAHILSYSVCLYSVFTQFKHSQFIYLVAALYPIYFHAGCARAADGNFNAVCVFVVVYMSIVSVWMFYTNRKVRA
jgi:hypothetical protein